MFDAINQTSFASADADSADGRKPGDYSFDFVASTCLLDSWTAA